MKTFFSFMLVLLCVQLSAQPVFENGLTPTQNPDKVRWGGHLLQSTGINMNDWDLDFTDNGVNRTGRLSFWKNVGMGVYNPVPTQNSGVNIRLFVNAYNPLSLTMAENIGIKTEVEWSGAQVFALPLLNCANFSSSRLVFTSNSSQSGNGINTGNLSGTNTISTSATDVNLLQADGYQARNFMSTSAAGKLTINYMSNFHSFRPVYAAGSPKQKVTHFYGLKLDKVLQDSTPDIFDNVYGVFQEGEYDRNYFAGSVNIGGAMRAKNAKLAVKGHIVCEKVTVVQDVDAWPDYVFQKNYRLRRLSEVERFIQRHHHLPDVPAATDEATRNLDLAAGQAVLLRKIEELTLYMIEQDKQIKALKARLNRQGKKAVGRH